MQFYLDYRKKELRKLSKENYEGTNKRISQNRLSILNLKGITMA